MTTAFRNGSATVSPLPRSGVSDPTPVVNYWPFATFLERRIAADHGMRFSSQTDGAKQADTIPALHVSDVLRRGAASRIAPPGRTRPRDHRAGQRRPGNPHGLLCRRPLPAAGRSGARQDAVDQDARPGGAPEIQPRPVHAGSDAVRHHRHRSDRGRSRHRPPRNPLHSRPGVCERDPGRRDQPDAAENAGGTPRSDAGIPGDGQRRALRTRAAAVRSRDAESDRAGRHIPAARSPARPLHVQHRHRLSIGGRRASHPRVDDRHERAVDRAGGDGAGHRSHAASGARDSGRVERRRLRAANRPRQPPGRRRRRRSSVASAAVGEVGCGAARRSGADPRRQGTRAAARPECCGARRCAGSRTAGAPAPHPLELPSRSRRCGCRSDCRPAARVGIGRPVTVVSGSPEVLAGIADLELVARIVVEGLVSGLHRSPFHGYSAEFSQYRHYRPGDDLKYVDWKLVARTDRVYTKQFRETTNMAASIVLDTSRSMDFPAGVSKLRYGVIAAAALAHLISMQGDSVGLHAGDTIVAPRAGRHHLRGLLAALSGLLPTDVWRSSEAVRTAAERLKRRGLLIVFSDLYDDEERTFAELRRAARMGHEVVVLQVLSREELDLPYRRDLEFTDLETGQRLAIDAGFVRRDYKDAVAAFLERWRTRAGAEGFQYALMVTDTPPARALRNLLLARRR